MLQTVQEIEAQCGFPILRLNKFYKDGRLVEVIYSANGSSVFRQTNPFTDAAEYNVDLGAYRRIVYTDPTR